MSVTRKKSEPAKSARKSPPSKPELPPALKAQLEASIAKHPYKFPEATYAELKDVRDELVLDLRGMADALWAMSYCDKNSGFSDGPMHMALHWVYRELERKAQRVEDVSHRVLSEINASRRGEL